MKNEAEKKFWRSPELVEELVSFLDTGSILTLAKCHQLTLDVLNSGNSVWNKLCSRTVPVSIRINLGHIRPPRVMSDRMIMTTGGVLVRERAELINLIAILKMLEEPKTRLVALRDLICQRFAPYEDQQRLGGIGGDDHDGEDDVNIWEAYPAQLVQLSDSRNKPCSVSLLGFWILQEIEENFGCGVELKIGGIMIDHLEEPWLTFLNLRHQDVMARFDTYTVRCEGQEDVEVISSLLQQHQNVKMETGMGIGHCAERHVLY